MAAVSKQSLVDGKAGDHSPANKDMTPFRRRVPLLCFSQLLIHDSNLCSPSSDMQIINMQTRTLRGRNKVGTWEFKSQFCYFQSVAFYKKKLLPHAIQVY